MRKFLFLSNPKSRKCLHLNLKSQNGRKIAPSNHYKLVEDGEAHSLIILGVGPEDEGKYECIAINNYGQASCEAKLILQSAASLGAMQGEAPAIVEPMKAIIVKRGQPAVFRCRFSGNARKYCIRNL